MKYKANPKKPGEFYKKGIALLAKKESMGVKCKMCGKMHEAGSIQHKVKSKNWIQQAIKKPGALHRQLGVKQGQKIPASKIRAAAKKGGTLGRRARLAQTLAGLRKKKA